MNKPHQPKQPAPPRWWISVDADAQGPFIAHDILAQLTSGTIDGSTLACLEGTEQWKTLAEWKQFRNAVTFAEPAELPSEDADESEAFVFENDCAHHSPKRAPTTGGKSNEIPGIISALDRIEKTTQGWNPRVVFVGILLVLGIFFAVGPFRGCALGRRSNKTEPARQFEDFRLAPTE